MWGNDLPLIRSDSMRRAIHIVTFLLLVSPSAWIAWKWRAMPHLGLFHDDALFYISAKSLAAGNGYRIESLPAQPYQTKYPPLYPFLLAGIWKTAPYPNNLRAGMLLNWIFLPVVLLAAYLLFRLYGNSETLSWVMTAVIALNPITIILSTTMMSVLFVAFAFTALLLAERRGDTLGLNTAFVVGVIVSVAYLTRTLGIVLIVSIPLCWIIRRQFRSAVIFAITVLPAVIAWQTWVARHITSARDSISVYYTSYTAWYIANVHLADLPQVISSNARAYLSSIGHLLVYDQGDLPWSQQMAWVVAAAAFAGFYRVARRTGYFQLLAFSVILSLIIIFWNFAPTERFVYPVYPLLVMGFVSEISRLSRLVTPIFRSGTLAERTIATVLSGFAVVLGIFAIYGCLAGITASIPGFYSFRASTTKGNSGAYEWTRGNTDVSATFLAYDDVLLYLATSRRAEAHVADACRDDHWRPGRRDSRVFAADTGSPEGFGIGICAYHGRGLLARLGCTCGRRT